METRDSLKRLIYEKAFKYSEEPIFQLASGRKSNYYVNLKEVSWSGAGAASIGELIYEKIKDLKVDAAGGMAAGADPLAMATVMECNRRGMSINGFSVRKEAKGHGLKKLVEGAVKEGDRIVILEDVVTTGGSTIKAIERAREFGLEVVHVITVVDREEGGRENIENTGVKLESLVLRSELVELARQKQ